MGTFWLNKFYYWSFKKILDFIFLVLSYHRQRWRYYLRRRPSTRVPIVFCIQEKINCTICIQLTLPLWHPRFWWPILDLGNIWTIHSTFGEKLFDQNPCSIIFSWWWMVRMDQCLFLLSDLWWRRHGTAKDLWCTSTGWIWTAMCGGSCSKHHLQSRPMSWCINNPRMFQTNNMSYT